MNKTAITKKTKSRWRNNIWLREIARSVLETYPIWCQQEPLGCQEQNAAVQEPTEMCICKLENTRETSKTSQVSDQNGLFHHSDSESVINVMILKI